MSSSQHLLIIAATEMAAHLKQHLNGRLETEFDITQTTLTNFTSQPKGYVPHAALIVLLDATDQHTALLPTLRRVKHSVAEQPHRIIVIDNSSDFELYKLALQQGAADVIIPEALGRLTWIVLREMQGLQLEIKHQEAELAHSHSEAQYRATLETMTEGVVLQTRAGSIRLSNTAAETILGLSADQLSGRTSTDPRWRAIHEDGSPFLGETHPAMVALRTGEAQKGVIMGVHKPNGSLSWISINANPVLIPGHREPIAVVSTFADITEQRMARQHLHESEARYRLLADNVSDMMARHHVDGTYTYVTPSSLSITGYQPEELINCLPYDFFHPDDLAAITKSHQTVLEENTNHTVTYRWRHRDGHYVWLETTSRAIRNPQTGKSVELVTVSRDVSARIAAEMEVKKQHTLLRKVIDLNPNFIFVKDLTGRFVLVNQALADIFNGTTESLLGKRDTDINPIQAETDFLRQIDEWVISSGKRRWIPEEVITDGTGRKRHLESVKLPLFDEAGEVTHILGVSTDITQRIQVEELLQAALGKERELSDLKTRFIGMASHEFRTPLAAILATVETLSIYRARMDDIQIENRLEKIRLQVQHMQHIIDEVLQLAQAQAGRVEFKPTLGDLDDLLTQIIEEFETQPANQGRLQYEISHQPLIFNFDNRLMRQIISNLIENALKYSANDKPIRITLARNTSQIIFTVQDYGIGISPEDRKRLFEPFHRGANVGIISGRGLGLHITQLAVQLHSGTIEVTSQLNRGSTITVTLPER